MKNKLYCGAAKGKITPPEDLLPNLRGLMDRHFGPVIDDLYLRVIALKNGEDSALLVTFDLDKVPCPKRYLEALAEAIDVPEESILLAAIHTHTAPIAGMRPNEGPNNIAAKPAEVQAATHQYEEFIQKVLIVAAKEAVSKMVPAKMGMGKGKSYIGVDRKQFYETEIGGAVHRKYGIGANPESPIDRTVYVLRFEDFTGKPIAFFINFPVHCCVLNGHTVFGGKLGISGDIAGNVCRWNEENYPDAVTLWSSGAAGDINPVVMYEMGYPDPMTGRMKGGKVEGDHTEILTCISAMHYDDIKKVNRTITCDQTDVKLGGLAEMSETPGKREPFKIRLHMMRLGEIFFLGASGELYDVFAKNLRKRIAARELIVVNHDASLMGDGGYIADDETLLQPRPMLPGVGHTNQQPGFFMRSLFEHTASMYEKLDARAIDNDQGPKGPDQKRMGLM